MGLPNGMEIEWDCLKMVKIYVPATMKTPLCGICGDNNGSLVDDKMVGQNDVLATYCQGKRSLKQKFTDQVRLFT